MQPGFFPWQPGAVAVAAGTLPLQEPAQESDESLSPPVMPLTAQAATEKSRERIAAQNRCREGVTA
jgi:hypothetical protein